MFLSYIQDFSPECSNGLNWLSRAHGPSPDHVGVVSYEDHKIYELFICAIWPRRKDIVVALEIVDKKRTKREEEITSHLCGWILHSLRWTVTMDGKLHCGDEVINVSEGDEWRQKLYREISLHSVEIAIATPSGADLTNIVQENN